MNSTGIIHKGLKTVSRLTRGNYDRLNGISAVQPEEFRAAAGKVEMACLHWPGDGPPLVMLHGLNSSPWTWARTASVLCCERDVYAVSLRGHGGSSIPETGYSLDRVTGDLHEFIRNVVKHPIDLAGHSWGGRAAIKMAAEDDNQLVRSLILADPVPPQGLNRLLRSFPSMIVSAYRTERNVYRDENSMKKAAKNIIYLQAGDHIDQNVWQDKFVKTDTGRMKPKLPDAGFNEIMNDLKNHDITDLLKLIEIPVLLLKPTLSVAFLPGELKHLKRRLKRLSIKKIPGDHTFIHSNPLDTAKALLEFLRS